MKRLYVALLAVNAISFGAAASAAEVTAKIGIVKGTVIVAGKPTSDVVVSIEGGPAENAKAQIAAAKAQKKVIDQRNAKFIPTVLAILIGTSVDFPNNDTSWHNVYAKGGAKDFDLGLYPPGKSRSVIFDKPGVARILCNAHPNMEAFVVVKEHRFFAAADKSGNYRIDAIPLGKYRLTVWHPELGTTEAEVELMREGQVSVIDFDLKKK